MKVDSRMLSTRFEVAFNQIHYCLKNLVQSKNENFIHVLNLAKDQHSSVRPYYDILRQYAKLRNSLVHYKLEPVNYIAEPHIEVVEDIEAIQKILSKPPLAMSIASKNVSTFEISASLDEILMEFDKTGFSQFPVYKGRQFLGLLTEGGIARWLSQNIQNGVAMTKDITAKDILKLEKKHNVDFIKRTQDIYELECLFEDYFEQNKKLEAIIITENGELNESPVGIITTWDLVQIDHRSLPILANS